MKKSFVKFLFAGLLVSFAFTSCDKVEQAIDIIDDINDLVDED